MKDIYELFYAVLSNNSSPEERIRFDEFIKSEENRRLFNQVQKIWNESPMISHYMLFDKRKAFYDLQRKVEQNKRLKKRYIAISMISVAASVIFMLGIFNLFSHSYFFNRNTTISFQTESGNRSLVVLPDSTTVWLNSRSKIQYGSEFGKESRTVKLTGEGFFNVTPGKKPFIVDVRDLSIRVYGTRFNVSAYNEDREIFTCLESGKISIEKRGEKAFVLEPGQLVTYSKRTERFDLLHVNAYEYSAWKENKMYLYGESLLSLAAKLERKYNVRIMFNPSGLGEELHYTGVFGDENIEEVLDAISVASDLKYSKKGNEYEIIRK